MRLAINGRFYANRVTGVQRFARELCSRLFDRQETVLFLPCSFPRPAEVPEHVRVVHGRLAGHAWEQIELPWMARAERCDVVLHPGGTAPGWGGPHVVVIHDLTPLTHPEWFTAPFRWWFRFALGRSSRRAAGVVAISEWTRREAERLLAIRSDRIRVVRQGLEPFSEPASCAAIEHVRSRWGLPERFLLGVGGRSRRKNLDFLLAVLARWRERHGDAPCLVVVGEGFSRLHSQAALHPGPGLDVRMLGHVPDGELHALYTGASVLCFPSLAEGFGRPPLEAMACGTPAVVSDYACAAEAVGAGAVIVPLEIERWVDAVRTLVEDQAEREKWSIRGREHAARYRWAQATDELVDACRAAAAPGREGV